MTILLLRDLEQQVVKELRRVSCECDICQSYCKHTPGWFLPGEMEQAAQLLDMTASVFFKKYVTVDYWIGDTIFTLRPRTRTESGGTEAPIDPRGQCVFFKKGKCQIHAAKPHECAVLTHASEIPDRFHRATAEAWQQKQASIAKLLDREPAAPEMDFMDIFRFLIPR